MISIADLLNGFAVTDLPLLLFQLFSAALLAFLVSYVNKEKLQAWFYASASVMISLGTALSKQSVALSVILAGVLILFGLNLSSKENSFNRGQFLHTAMIGFGCGAGFVIPVYVVYILIILPLIFLGRRN